MVNRVNREIMLKMFTCDLCTAEKPERNDESTADYHRSPHHCTESNSLHISHSAVPNGADGLPAPAFLLSPCVALVTPSLPQLITFFS